MNGTLPVEEVYCECFDHDADGDIDAQDVTVFTGCGSGPDVPWAPSEGCP